MASLYTHQDTNVRKTWLLMAVFFGVVLAFGWAASWYFGSPVILYVAVAFALVMNVGSYWYAHKLVVATSGAKHADPRDYPELHNIVENLAITAGLPKPEVYIMDDPSPNAFATGRNPEHAVVAVTTGLLRILNRTELEGVLAHELSHVGNRDMLVATIAVTLVGFVALLSDFFLRGMIFGMGNDREGAGGIIALVGAIVIAILAPLVATLIQLSISRKREFLADASGALLTRYPEGLASALQKISQHAEPMRRANHATAHLFISDPFGKEHMARKIHSLFQTHPPVEDRVQALRHQ